MTIEVTTPAYPSYLYVTYLTASGDALHLEWPTARVPKAAAPNSRVVFGGGADGRTFRVGPPFGDETIVVVAAASPLFPDGMPERAIDREYLTAFRRAFLFRPDGANSDRVVSAALATLKTVP
jgi:hypothetical protein